MTPDQVIAYAEKHFGEKWKARLARELSYSPSTITRLASGQIPEVSRRMELEMKQLMRKEQMKYMTEHTQDVKY